MTDSNPIAELQDAELQDAELQDAEPQDSDALKKEFMQRVAGNWSKYSWDQECPARGLLKI
jgi:hypothetical protein